MKRSIIILLCAIVSFSAFAETDNAEAQKMFKLGIRKLDHQLRLEAKEYFSKAINLDDNYSEAYFERALIHKHFKDYAKAIEDLEKAASTKDKKLAQSARFELAHIKTELEDYEGARSEYSAILKKDPENTRAIFLRGKTYLLTSKYDEAAKDFDKASELDPENPDYLYHKGLIEIEKANYKEALSIMEKVAEKNPKHADAHFYIGYSHYELVVEAHDKHKHSHLVSALEAYNRALDLNPNIEEAYFDRGEVRMQLKDYVGAIADFKRAIELKPDDLEAHYQKAMCNFHYGYIDQAIEEMDEILLMDSTYSNALYQRALWLYEIDNDYEASERMFSRLMALEEEHADAHYFRALTRIELGVYEGACQDLKRAEEMGYDVENYIMKDAKCK